MFLRAISAILLVFVAANGQETTPTEYPPPPSDEECRLALDSEPFSGKCGEIYENDVHSSTQFEGKTANRGQIPWQAFLYNGCGGTIIDESHVLTAANCIWSDAIGKTVSFGHIYSNASSQADECTFQRRAIVRADPHPCFCSEGVQCGIFPIGSCGSISSKGQ